MLFRKYTMYSRKVLTQMIMIKNLVFISMGLPISRRNPPVTSDIQLMDSRGHRYSRRAKKI